MKTPIFDEDFLYSQIKIVGSDVTQTVVDTTEEWLDEHIDPESGYALDDTLSLTVEV